MSLNKIISEAIDANEDTVGINRHGAIEVAVPLVMADPDLTETCVRGHVSRLITSNAKRRASEASSGDSRQTHLFGLNEMHVLDDEGHTIKRTRQLSRLEFMGLIRIRQEKVDQDLAYLGKLREAARETGTLWDRHPDWTWGDIEDAYARLRRVA